MATRTRPGGSTGDPTFSEVLGENAPYIAAMYVLNLVVVLLSMDYGALAEGQLTYNALVAEGAGGGVLGQAMAAAMAGLFLVVTLVGVLYAVSLANEKRRESLDAYEMEERISTISIVPAMQLFAIVLSPLLTRHSIVRGFEFLIRGIEFLI